MSFDSLPSEILEKIVQYVAPPRSFKNLNCRFQPTSYERSDSLSTLFVNRRLHAIAARVVYSKNRYYLKDPRDVQDFLAKIGPTNSSRIQALHLHMQSPTTTGVETEDNTEKLDIVDTLRVLSPLRELSIRLGSPDGIEQAEPTTGLLSVLRLKEAHGQKLEFLDLNYMYLEHLAPFPIQLDDLWTCLDGMSKLEVLKISIPQREFGVPLLSKLFHADNAESLPALKTVELILFDDEPEFGPALRDLWSNQSITSLSVLYRRRAEFPFGDRFFCCSFEIRRH